MANVDEINASRRAELRQFAMGEDEKTILVCMRCMTPNADSDEFCQNCRAPLGETSGLDPVQSIRDEGFLLREAASGSPRFLVVAGTWILFFPWIIGTIALEASIISNWDGFPSFIFFLGGIALFLFAVKMLYAVTKNYLNAREKHLASRQIKDLQTEKRLRAKAKRQARMKQKPN